MNNSRRQFIKKAGLGLSAAYFLPQLLSCESKKPGIDSPFANIGVQLYSIRDLMTANPTDSLQQVSKIGYKHVETYGIDTVAKSFWGLDYKSLKKVLDDNGLKSHSGHYDMSKYFSRNHQDKEDLNIYFDAAKELGQEYVIAPVSPMFDISALKKDDFLYIAEQLNKAGEAAKKHGLKVAFHNHFWEFRDLGNGTKGEEVLLAFTEPDLVDFELDLYWAEKAGINPVSLFEKFPNRFKLWHIKDMDKAFTKTIVGPEFDKLDFGAISKEVKYTEVGTGHIDFIAIAQAKAKAGLKYAFVEQDDIYLPNKFESLKKSYDYVEQHLAKI
ncbi:MULTISPECIES: sugar phosphate isomerase/epimerase family protein [Sphingobacterium]|uniref:sugar phosphate isomerase/epimerase family protein n=1 Tax=Sphingobacterium TaxID=28453 RepID=UPI00104EAE0B|nr:MULTISPECIES: sugar phosphate isomerase/epimerase [Sphingobacterium]MBB2952751.1 sugar phosphate isomerase/epimerase [Sphingobacterium sp. JUb56]MCS3555577.1 sugar phosphate isomerase/epimerase [Sphingobacterium sp. JUb21]MCW2261214.1 sugar phosphate isomerase/epimerase [Sphingobacterium kitahiroshimense]NJI76007.1 sugar phosphate isomerase/epimerase [Sphingobacterium sp. B16(2022)]QQD14519.1 sugar phosphate isomerase/epimerase [Sphingobacterium sp. UDSM-2020]